MKQAKTVNSSHSQAVVSVNNLPDFLVEAQKAVDAGDIAKAKTILCEKTVERVCDIQDVGSRVLAIFALASLFRKIDQPDMAEEWYNKILEYGQYAFAYNELNAICKDKCDFIKAVEYGSKALSLEPDNPKLLSGYGIGLITVGNTDEGVEMLRRAVKIAPENEDYWRWFLYGLHYKPDIAPEILFETHKEWAKRNAPITMARTCHDNSLDPDRKLRVGYISPNFRRHSVAYFFESILQAHNHEAVEIYGYSNSKTTDEFTQRMKPMFDTFRDIYKLKDEQVDEMIVKDKIDILVDLAGHTSDNSLLVMARKSAPIQITYLGYPDTTGLEQIDYRITDELVDPPDLHKYYTEEQVCLPNGFLCYRPPDFAPMLTESPCIKNGYVTFGSFNINQKVNLEVMALWAQVLKRVADSRLLLKLRGGEHDDLQNYYRDHFQQLGIERDRIKICGRKSPYEHLAMYGQVDIALDTYPYHGTTTTCEALWMGVPIISLLGGHHSCRVSLSLLNRLDMDYFVTSTKEEYVAKACALAANPNALAKIRSTMRVRMAASDLCNGKLFTENLEAAYRKMWHKYCRFKGAEIKENESQNNLDYKPRRHANATAADDIISADKLYQAGKRVKSAEYAAMAFNKLSSEYNSEKLPQKLLQRYNADDLQSLILNFCMEVIAYSSYFSRNKYYRIYAKAKEVNPSNLEIDLKIGLLLALQARNDNSKLQDECIKYIEIAARKLNDERSKAVLAFVKGGLKELSLPYDLARIHLYPDLENITTYVLLEQGDWFEKNDLNFFRSIIQPDDIVFDLGANVGLYSISAASRTNGKVIAVEPALKTFELLNISASQFTNMIAVHSAISDKSGTAFLSHGNSCENFAISEGNETQGEQVPLLTVDAIAATYGIEAVDIIKMDVEGHELKAIAGAEKIISNGSPIIFYEVKHGSDLHPEFIEAFENLGYDSYFTLPDAKTLVKYDRDIPTDRFLLNMIAIRPESLHRLEGLANVKQSQTEVLATN
jgi:FkbM family methyltransferase